MKVYISLLNESVDWTSYGSLMVNEVRLHREMRIFGSSTTVTNLF